MKLTLYRCDFCGKRMEKPAAKMVIVTETSAKYDICKNCHEDIEKKVKESHVQNVREINKDGI